MRFLLDTSVLVDLIRDERAFPDRLRGLPPSDFGVSVISRYELCVGAYKSRDAEASLLDVRSLQFETLPFLEADAERAGRIRAELEAAGKRIDHRDTLIAGQALARSLTIITGNLRDFGRVPGLECENWTG